MSNELTGKLIVKNDTVQITDKFRKREFVVETSDENNGQVWTETILFQCINDRVSILDNISIGDSVTVGYNVRGRKYEKEGNVRYFNNLEAWRISKNESSSESEPSNEAPDNQTDESDLPF